MTRRTKLLIGGLGLVAIVVDGDCPEDALGTLLKCPSGFRTAHVRSHPPRADGVYEDALSLQLRCQ